MNMPTMNITLSEADARFILEALQTLENQWLKINHTTTDEDEQAEYGMDAIVLGMTREKFEAIALEAFGPHVRNFSRQPLVAEPTRDELPHDNRNVS